MDAGVDVTHVNLNDGVIEGIRSAWLRAFGVQYHPEAGPGPHDAAYLFAEFAGLMDGARGNGFGRQEPEVIGPASGTRAPGNGVREPVAPGGHRMRSGGR